MSHWALQEQGIFGLGLLLPVLREAARFVVPIEHPAQLETQSLRHGILNAQSRVLNSTSTRRSRRSSGSPNVPV